MSELFSNMMILVVPKLLSNVMVKCTWTFINVMVKAVPEQFSNVIVKFVPEMLAV